MASSNERPGTSGSLRPALSPRISYNKSTAPTASPRSASKVVFAEPDSISPLMRGQHKELDQGDYLDLDKTARQFRASTSGKRLTGRSSFERLGSAGKGMVGNPSLSSLLSEESDLSTTSPKHRQHHHDSLVKHVSAWLKQEKSRRAARKAKRKAAAQKHPQDAAVSEHPATSEDAAHSTNDAHARRGSESSEGSVALEQLAHIIERTFSMKSSEEAPKRRPSHAHRLSGIMGHTKRHSVVSSDTDYFEGAEELVPSCEAVLDNTKTMAYGAGGPEAVEDDGASVKSSRRAKKEKEAWATFKYEIVRLSHTLKLKGWRRVPLEQSNQISVERLSGALTNAVYVVSPPTKLHSDKDGKNDLPVPKKPPPKLLLRIYGPQVEHLIDRESELQILRRLARKRIGPRLLGTFTNGRFEEFFYAKTLTPQDLRIPETSKQIAKRMRELHEGIDLLRQERDDGPFVWRNWDKWVERCEQIVTWLDQQVREDRVAPSGDAYLNRGLLCGVEWPLFRKTVEKYRKWLEEQYGGIDKINERLVFAHNDTQYGNILRMEPAGESPLLMPANEHKQLVVIDFEYANANLPGLEFANHFTEWSYNYHDPDKPYACVTSNYPTPEEQYRFIRTYLTHSPTFKAPGGSASNPPTPFLGPLPTSGSTTALAACADPTSISAFMLDARAPPGEKYSYQEQEAQAEQRTEAEVRRLMAETRLWRLANSAQWTAWGIVQANIPGCPDFDKDKNKTEEESRQGQELDSATLEVRVAAEAEGEADGKVQDGGADAEQPADEEEEFDYLGYAQERAMFLWGDALRLGMIKPEELPEDVLKRVKLVDY